MKISLSINRKDGQPNYGSIGTQASIEFEVGDNVVRDPQLFRVEVSEAYALLETTIAEEMVRLRAAGQTPPPAPAVAPAPAWTPPPSPVYQTPTPAPSPTPAPTSSYDDGDVPRSGKALYRWAADADEQNGDGTRNFLSKLGKENHWPHRMVEWNESQVAHAVQRLRERRPSMATR